MSDFAQFCEPQELLLWLERQGFDLLNGSIERIESRWPTLDEVREVANELEGVQVEDETLDGGMCISIFPKGESWENSARGPLIQLEITRSLDGNAVELEFLGSADQALEDELMHHLARMCGPLVVVSVSYDLDSVSLYVGQTESEG